MTARPIVIIGAGGFGRETADVIQAINAAAPAPLWQLLGVYDDSPSKSNLSRLRDQHVQYLGPVPTSWAGEPINFVIGIGSPSVRVKLAQALEGLGWEAGILIHPAASVAAEGQIGSGTVICGGVQVSTNVRLGRHVHLNPNSTIGHDAILEDHVSINPAAVVSGEVHIMTRSLLGAGAVILQGLTVGPGALVGAAACVVRDVAPEALVKGVPAC